MGAHVHEAVAEVDGEAGVDFPIVLNVGFELGEAVPAFAVGVGFLILLEVTEEGVGEWIAGA